MNKNTPKKDDLTSASVKPTGEKATASEAALPVRLVDIDDNVAGQRIDNFLITLLKGVPKSRIYRIIRKGEVRVNKGRIKQTYKLKAGDVVRVPPIRVAVRDEVVVGQGLQKELESRILFENHQIIVIDKPSGLAVHGGSGISLGLIEALRTIRPEQQELELVHRLDRDTSGCILIAKKKSVLRALHRQLQNGEVDKRYQALVAGRWPSRCKTVNAPLKKNELKSGERVVKVTLDGKESRTNFRVLQRYADCTLMEAKPITGRTHQIRVHAQHVGNGLVGDEKYGDDTFNRLMRTKGIKRLFLHAASLAFSLPNSESKMVVHAPLPAVLQRALDSWQKTN